MDPATLPIRGHAGEIAAAVAANRVVVVIGETGSGKTTQIAQVRPGSGFAPRQPARGARAQGGRAGKGGGGRGGRAWLYWSVAARGLTDIEDGIVTWFAGLAWNGTEVSDVLCLCRFFVPPCSV